MSVSTTVRLNGYVTKEEILNFIKQKVNENVTSRVTRETNESLGTFYESGYIFFANKDKSPLALFYFYQSENIKENYDYWVKKGLKNMVETHTTELIMSYSEDSIKIIRMIAEEFGGWIDEDDSDDRYFEPIIKNSDGSIIPVIHVTMKDIYEKFGAVVIIDDLYS